VLDELGKSWKSPGNGAISTMPIFRPFPEKSGGFSPAEALRGLFKSPDAPWFAPSGERWPPAPNLVVFSRGRAVLGR
jgi:hypothetical protein